MEMGHPPTGCAPKPTKACLLAEVLAGSGHRKGSPSPPRGSRLSVLGTRLVGMARTERDKLARMAAKLRVEGMATKVGWRGMYN